MKEILVLYYSHTGGAGHGAARRTRGGAGAGRDRAVAHGAQGFSGIRSDGARAGTGAPYVEVKDLEECAGLALGSPTLRQHGRADEAFLGFHR